MHRQPIIAQLTEFSASSAEMTSSVATVSFAASPSATAAHCAVSEGPNSHDGKGCGKMLRDVSAAAVSAVQLTAGPLLKRSGEA